MNKKTVLSAFMTLVLAISIVCQIKAAKSPHTGFSAGVNLGHENLHVKLNHDLTGFGGEHTSNILGTHSHVFGVFLGYGWSSKITGIYLGTEIFVQRENIKGENHEIQDTPNGIADIVTKFQTKLSFGADAKIGYLLKDVLFFVKSGIVSVSNEAILVIPSKNGFLIGIGMDYAISQNWCVGGEFIYEIYNSVTQMHGILIYTPRKYTSNIRLKYTF